MMSYLKLALNPKDIISCERVINVPRRGVGETAWAKLVDWSSTSGISICEALGLVQGDESQLNALYKNLGLSIRAVSGIKSFRDLVRQSNDIMQSNNLAEGLEKIIDLICYREYIQKGEDNVDLERQGKLSRIDQLLMLASEMEAAYDEESNNADRMQIARSFIDRAALSSSDEYENTDSSLVKIMTMHAAKGLEFDIVYIPSCVEGLIPHLSYDRDEFDSWEKMDEETRLFFVSMTRAKTDLRLFFTKEHSLHGPTNRRPNKPSRFLDAILTSGYAAPLVDHEQKGDRQVNGKQHAPNRKLRPNEARHHRRALRR